MSNFAAQNIIENLGWTLLHFVWQGAIIAAALAVILRCCNRVSANTRYALGCSALLLLAIAPFATFSLIDKPFSLTQRIKIERDYADLPMTVDSEIAQPTSHRAKMVPASHLSWNETLVKSLPWLVFVWAIGVLVFSLRLAAAWARVNLLKRRFASPCDQPWPDKLAELSRRLTIDRPVRLLQSALVEVPSVIGWLRPVILLPASSFTGLSPAQLEAILAHELAHIRRHDYLVNVCQTILETILFYHPAVWWVSRQVRAEREHCCDDLAVETCGDRLNYARALATLEELRQPPVQLALAAGGAPLLRRIQRIVASPPANPSRPAWPFAGILILALLTLVAAGLRGGHAQADEGQIVQEPDPVTHINTLAPSNVTMVKTRGVIITPEPSDGRIHQLLKKITLEKLSMHLAPLPNVIKQLNDEALARYPDHRGIRFELSPDHAYGSGTISGSTNPEQYVGFVTISVPERQDITLADSLDLITLHADFPIQYVIFKDRVVFMKADVENRTFHLAHTEFNDDLKNIPGAPILDANGGQHYLYQPPALVKLFVENDINLITNRYGATPEAFVWNYLTGDLKVRATPQKLAKIQAVVNQFHPRQHIFTAVPIAFNPSLTEADNPNRASLEFRNFHVPENFIATLKKSHSDIATTESAEKQLPLLIRQFFKDAGMSLDTNNPANIGKSYVYNAREKDLMVRATTNDFNRIDAALESFQVITNVNSDNSRDTAKAAWTGSPSHSQAKPEINLKVKIAMVDEEQTHQAGIDWLFADNQLSHRETAAPIAALQNFPSITNSISSPRHPVTNSIISQFTGALDESYLKTLYSRLENTFGVDVLTVPEVTTELAREAMVMEGEQDAIVTGANVVKNGKNPTVNYISETISFGPIVDMVPKLNETNGLIDLRITSSIGEFAGYAEPHDLVKGTSEFPSYENPHPQFHLWQMRAEKSVTNRETLVIVGLSAPETNVVKDNVPVLGSIPLLGRLFRSTTITKTKKDLVILVTPTLINPDGSRWKEPAK